MSRLSSFINCPVCKQPVDDALGELIAIAKCNHVKFHKQCLPACADCRRSHVICRGRQGTVFLNEPVCLYEEACLLCVQHAATDVPQIRAATNCGHSFRAVVHERCVPECAPCARRRCCVPICRGTSQGVKTVLEAVFVPKTVEKR
jgi:hypothetical protein